MQLLMTAVIVIFASLACFLQLLIYYHIIFRNYRTPVNIPCQEGTLIIEILDSLSFADISNNEYNVSDSEIPIASQV
jgi:hypothetical protein